MTRGRMSQGIPGLVAAAALVSVLASRGASAAEPAGVIPAPAAEAKQVLELSGVQGGLIVHFGCTDGQLTAALRSGDSCLEPQNARHHETLASVSVAVSAGGRLFTIIDEAPAASVLLPPQWRLVARDAFNGVLLKWSQEVPLLARANGMAAARGRLYLAMQDGRLLCLSDSRSPGGVELPRLAGKTGAGAAAGPGQLRH